MRLSLSGSGRGLCGFSQCEGLRFSERENPESSASVDCDVTPNEQWPEAESRSARLYLVKLHSLCLREYVKWEMIAVVVVSIIVESPQIYHRREPFAKLPRLFFTTSLIGSLTVTAPQENEKLLLSIQTP